MSPHIVAYSAFFLLTGGIEDNPCDRYLTQMGRTVDPVGAICPTVHFIMWGLYELYSASLQRDEKRRVVSNSVIFYAVTRQGNVIYYRVLQSATKHSVAQLNPLMLAFMVFL